MSSVIGAAAGDPGRRRRSERNGMRLDGLRGTCIDKARPFIEPGLAETGNGGTAVRCQRSLVLRTSAGASAQRFRHPGPAVAASPAASSVSTGHRGGPAASSAPCQSPTGREDGCTWRSGRCKFRGRHLWRPGQDHTPRLSLRNSSRSSSSRQQMTGPGRPRFAGGPRRRAVWTN